MKKRIFASIIYITVTIIVSCGRVPQTKKERSFMKFILTKVKTYFGKLDKLLLLMCAGIAGFAVFIQYTLYTNDISEAVSDSQYKTQLIAVIGGIIIAMIIAAINYKFIAKLWYIYGPIALGLTLLLFTSLGLQREGADDIGWLDFGIMTIQPSEILKLAFILSFAYHLSKVEDRMNEPIHFILLCIHGAVPTLIIVETGDDGSALVFIFIFICMMIAAGLSWKYMALIAVAIPPGVYVLWNYLMQPHQQKRFQVLWDTQMQQEEALGIYMQQRVGKIALGSGGLTGLGLSGGDYTYVPEIHNDFIFSYIGMTMGLLGCLLVVGLLALLSLKILSNSSGAKDTLGRMICIGVFALIVFHTTINIGMVLGVAPVIGIPLPFFSAGGTSAVCLFVAIGLVLSVSFHNSTKYRMFYTEKD